MGRIVIPKPIRERFGFENNTSRDVFADENGIFIRKYQPECLVCGSNEDIQIKNGKKFCKKCFEKLSRE